MKKILQNQLKVITENTVDCISQEELLKKLELSLRKKQPLRLKIGFDPTARDIHLGHTVLLRKLRKIQDLGHIIYFIIGDFTARIGDPSGRSELRPVLSIEEIKDNAKTYTTQAFKILDKNKTKIFFNSEWFSKMSASDFVGLLSRYTVARMMERDDFSQRLKSNKPLSIQEFVYPIIQGYDSVMVEADIEFGGTDQKFNLIVGRHLQESFGQSPQVVITLPLLVGLDGQNKMSKSLGNYVGIMESPKSMFGKLMSISDELMWEYFRLLTDVDIKEAKNMHPKEAKLLLAETIVSLYHNTNQAHKERVEFERVFSKKETPSDISEYMVSGREIDVIDVLHKSGCVSTRNEARRLLKQKGITCNGQIVSAQKFVLPAEEAIFKIGKRRFLKVKEK